MWFVWVMITLVYLPSGGVGEDIVLAPSMPYAIAAPSQEQCDGAVNFAAHVAARAGGRLDILEPTGDPDNPFRRITPAPENPCKPVSP